jgi:hypothetical protein
VALMDSRKFKFGTWDGDPFVWTPGDAWVFSDGAWRPANSSVVGMEGRVLSMIRHLYCASIRFTDAAA